MKERPYSVLAALYDHLMDQVDYDMWLGYILQLIEKHGDRCASVLDLACGTGNMACRLAEKGFQVIGVDSSQEMLDIARKKGDFPLVQGDMRSFSLAQTVDVVICVYDSLNYLLTTEDLLKTFQSVRTCLRPGGIFIFDFNTRSRIKRILEGTHLFEGPGYSCFWKDYVQLCQSRWHVELTIFLKEGREVYRKYCEEHVEQGYTIDEMEDAAQKAGFQILNWLRAYTLEAGSNHDDRVYGICKA